MKVRWLQKRIFLIAIFAIALLVLTTIVVALITVKYGPKNLGLYSLCGTFLWMGLTTLFADIILESEYAGSENDPEEDHNGDWDPPSKELEIN